MIGAPQIDTPCLSRSDSDDPNLPSSIRAMAWACAILTRSMIAGSALWTHREISCSDRLPNSVWVMFRWNPLATTVAKLVEAGLRMDPVKSLIAVRDVVDDYDTQRIAATILCEVSAHLN